MTTLENNLTQILNEKRQKIIPSNIRRGVKILNVTGTYGGEGAEVEEYDELKYVELDGNQYLDTLYPLWKSTTWKIDYKFNVPEFYNYIHLFSVADDDTLNEMWINVSGKYNIRLSNSSAGKKEFDGYLATNTDYEMQHICKDDILTTEMGNSIIDTYDCSSGSHPNLSLRFGKRDTGVFRGKLYYLKMYDNDVLVRDFIPVKILSTKRIALYDKVEQKYYYSSGTSDFIAGPSISEIEITPSAEKQVIEGSFTKVTILGDSDLKPNNIRKGVNIFGVTGELTISGSDTSYNVKIEKPVGNNGSIVYMISEIGEIDLEGITRMHSMFSNCQQLKKILGIYNTSSVKTMRQCFYNCSSLEEIPYFDTSGVTNMTNAFQNCKLITTIPELDFSSLADAYQNYGVYGMFNGCTSLKNIPTIPIGNLEMLNSMFYGCSSLETIPELNTQKVNNVYTTFNGCSSLKNFGGFLNLGKGYTQKTVNYNVYIFDLSACSQLTHDSLMNVINKLYNLNLTYNVAGGGTLYTQTLKIGATNKAKLTAEEIAIATNKRMDRFIKEGGKR